MTIPAWFIPLIIRLIELSGVPKLEDYNLRIGQEIVVSYYAYEFHGRRTANGETYNMYDYTCASPCLPFDTELILRYNQNEVLVRVNDRGPFAVDSTGMARYPLQPHPIRRLDLSLASFEWLTDSLELGIAEVEIVGVRFHDRYY